VLRSRLRGGLIWVSSALAISVALSSCGSSAPAATSSLKLPVIADDITPGPCSQTSQIAMDYCAGDQLVAADHLINAQMALVWAHTPSSVERRELAKAFRGHGWHGGPTTVRL
jgi:hypothetical protein